MIDEILALFLDLCPTMGSTGGCPECQKLKAKALTAIYEIGLGVIGATEVVPPNFEKLLPDRQRQMDYKSLMWSRNDLRKEQRKAWAKACGVAE